MKAKYLFYSLALASAFTACTQDELFDVPALENNEVAGRPIAGVVTFVGDEVDSRYNKQNATFEEGDKLGLYLMDSYNYAGESGNRNSTYWQWQSCWWKMYEMQNYISSNYAYVNDGDGNWVNHASRLVEGNYVALFPQNEVATNRAELWHPIKANVDLVAHTTKKRYYVNRDNQFFVGYEQIHRDQEAQADGNLEAKISMKPILTYARMKFDNNQADKIRLRKVVFTKQDNDYLPNVAYIEPKKIVMTDAEAQEELETSWNAITPMMDGLKAPYWAWSNREAMAEYDANKYCGVEGTPYRQGKYDRTTFTHAAARSMVRYVSTGTIPYGFDARTYAKSKEYTFNFPGNGVILNGNDEGNDKTLTRAEISIALPAFEGWNEMKVIVYADRLKNEDAEDEEWVAGYISSQRASVQQGNQGLVNADWNLESLQLWDNDKMNDFGTVELRIDDEYFVALSEIEVNSSDDFYNLVKGRLADANTAKDVNLTVKPYEGTILNVNENVVKLIDAYEAKYGDRVNITFTGDVKLNAENSIHKFNYAGVKVYLNASQMVTEAITSDNNGGISELINEQGTLTVLANIGETIVNNKNVMVVETGIVNNLTKTGYVKNLNNSGILTLKKNSGAWILKNMPGAQADIEAGDGSVNVSVLYNQNGDVVCDDCAKAVLNVKTGTLNVTTLNNNAIVNVESTLNAPTFNNKEQHAHAGKQLEAIVNNNGTIKTFIMNNKGTVNNYGDITPAAVDGMTGNAKLLNEAVVNGHDGNIKYFQNTADGVLYVKSEELHVESYNFSGGKIIFEGVANQHVGKNSKDERIFQTTAAIKGSEINNIMTFTKVTTLWLSHDVTIDYTDETGEKSLWSKENREAVTSVVVKAKKSVGIKSEITGKKLTLKNAELDVEAEGKLTLSNAIKMTVKSFTASDDIDVATGSSLKDENGNEWNGVNHN